MKSVNMRSFRFVLRVESSFVVPIISGRSRNSLVHNFSSSPSSSQVEITKHLNDAESIPSCYDTENATVLVDSLLAKTKSLMQQSGSLASHHFIAFSGGVDSSLAAALVHRIGNDFDSIQVQAVLGISAAVPAEQRDLASRVAHQIGIPLQQVLTKEGTDPTYIANEGQACLACKTHLYSTLQAIYASVSSGESVQLYNGTNADDLQDPTRVGLIAAQRFQVLSPLQHISKDQVRLAARQLGLLNWNYAASPCLRSRLALGVHATRDHLERIERAERFVRQRLMHTNENIAFDETSNLRVRLLAKNRVCIELDEGIALEYAHEHVVSWKDFLEKELEFASVQVRGFRSGSVAIN